MMLPAAAIGLGSRTECGMDYAEVRTDMRRQGHVGVSSRLMLRAFRSLLVQLKVSLQSFLMPLAGSGVVVTHVARLLIVYVRQ